HMGLDDAGKSIRGPQERPDAMAKFSPGQQLPARCLAQSIQLPPRPKHQSCDREMEIAVLWHTSGTRTFPFTKILRIDPVGTNLKQRKRDGGHGNMPRAG